MSHGRRLRVCIVTPGYIATSPRVVKEADALHAAGLEVRVVFSQGQLGWARRFDDALLRGKDWDWQAVRWSAARPGERALYWWSRLRHNAARRLPASIARGPALAAMGEGRVYQELARRAAVARADLYIGHYPAGLAAAARAAGYWGVKLGYDVEDLHTEEQGDDLAGRRQTARIRAIEREYLPRCVHISAVSEPIAVEIERRYRVTKPLVVHNTFPWTDRSRLDGRRARDRRGPDPSLYWYSQTIGLDRGIEDILRAVPLLDRRVQVHLRGVVTTEVRERLAGLAREGGFEGDLHFHEPVPSDELLERAVEHDIGLALDQPVNLSRMLSVTNKFFFYLLAGLAVVATDIPGHGYVMSQCPRVGLLYLPGDHRGLARRLDRWLARPAELAAAKQAALEAARTRWNWETELEPLVRNVRKVLAS